MSDLIPVESIERKIFVIKGQKVMIDRDLAEFYGVETKYLNRQVNRNIGRFPAEFMFRLTRDEKIELVTNWHRFRRLKHSSSLPFVFTEHGVAMLASVLKGEKAAKVSIYIVKAFISLRRLLSSHKYLGEKLNQLARKVTRHDTEIQDLVKLIKKMIE
ncbi:MAG: ORF6N domain-containing protein, partial [Candidatus Margulisiibacteriota bacterium]